MLQEVAVSSQRIHKLRYGDFKKLRKKFVPIGRRDRGSIQELVWLGHTPKEATQLKEKQMAYAAAAATPVDRRGEDQA